MALKRLVGQIKEAIGAFDVSDTPVEGPTKAPAPKMGAPKLPSKMTPLNKLKVGVKQPIKNKLPGMYNAPSKATSSALSVFKRESRQTFASFIAEGRGLTTRARPRK